MTWLTTLIIAVGLGMDAFAVALAVGSQREKLTFRPMFRLSFHFGLFQFLMPVIGWYAGTQIDQYLRAVDHWIAFALLGFIGARMIRDSFCSDEEHCAAGDPTRKWTMVALSVATSIDALAVGLSMAMIGVEVWTPAAVIGIVALVMTAAGMVFGRRLGARFGRRMELVGGLVLIGIGVKIVIEHLF
jgi:putative Mn2+ efflux pump MntP